MQIKTQNLKVDFIEEGGIVNEIVFFKPFTFFESKGGSHLNLKRILNYEVFNWHNPIDALFLESKKIPAFLLTIKALKISSYFNKKNTEEIVLIRILRNNLYINFNW